MILSLRNHEIRTPEGRQLQAAFDLELRPGDRIGVTGPSGCGKSMLLRQIADAQRTQTHSIRSSARAFDYVPQADYLFPWYTARQNYCAWRRKSNVDRDHAAIARTLGVEDLFDRSYGRLSGGERQRVALWLLLCSDADLVAFDEPFTALDIERKVICMEALALWLNQGQRSLIVVSHDFEILTYLSNTIVLFGKDVGPKPTHIDLRQPLPSSRQEYLQRRRAGAYEGVIDALAGSAPQDA